MPTKVAAITSAVMMERALTRSCEAPKAVLIAALNRSATVRSRLKA
jgi:hypothetical protein